MEARLQNALMRLPHERPMERISVRLKQHGDVTFRLFSKIMPYGYFSCAYILHWLIVVLLFALVLKHSLLKWFREYKFVFKSLIIAATIC